MRAYIAAGVSVASLCVGFAAFFHVGIWYQTEPAQIALYGAGAVAALVIIARPGGSHPFVWLPLALALWSLATSWAQPFPGRSWFGPPETGEGAAWWLAVAALTSCGMTACAGARSVIQFSTAGLAAIYALVLIIAPDSLGRWSAWGGFLAPLVIMIARPRWLGLCLGLGLAIVSDSKGAWLVLGLGLWAWVMLELWSDRHGSRWGGAVAVAAALATVTWGTAFAPWPSAQSRVVLWSVAVDMLTADPWRLAYGYGWGAFNDLVLSDWPRLADRVPSWEGLGAGAFHSHSLIVESTLALGLPGLTLVLGLMVAVPLRAADVLVRGEEIITGEWPWTAAWWAAWCGIACVWFPLPVAAPFLALALAYVSGRVPRPSLRAMLWPAGATIALTITALSAWTLSSAAGRVLDVMNGPARDREMIMLPSMGRGGQHLWALSMLIEVETARREASGAGVPLDAIVWRRAVRESVEREIAAGRASDRLRSMALIWRR